MTVLTTFFTRRGDRGSTCVCGECVSKAAAVVAACGALDELNSLLGLARAESWDKKMDKVLETIQRDLFVVGADIAVPLADKKTKRITRTHIAKVERLICGFSRRVVAPRSFVLPAGSRTAALLHVARAVCRRAEGCAVAAAEQRRQNPLVVAFLNRLSSLLFVLALYANKQAGVREKTVPKLAKK